MNSFDYIQCEEVYTMNYEELMEEVNAEENCPGWHEEQVDDLFLLVEDGE